jgi:hypothetical protein
VLADCKGQSCISERNLKSKNLELTPSLCIDGMRQSLNSANASIYGSCPLPSWRNMPVILNICLFSWFILSFILIHAAIAQKQYRFGSGCSIILG